MGKKGAAGKPKGTRQTRKVKTEEGAAAGNDPSQQTRNMDVTQTQDFHRRNNMLHSHFALPTKISEKFEKLAKLKKEKEAEEEPEPDMMEEDQPLGHSARENKSVLLEEEEKAGGDLGTGRAKSKEQAPRAKASIRGKRGAGGGSSASGSKASRGQTVVEEPSPALLEHELERSQEEDQANNLAASTLDKSQYYPIMLEYDDDDENGNANAGAQQSHGVEETGAGEGDRQDMNGAMTAERGGPRSSGDRLANFSEQEEKDLIENGNNFIMFQFPVELPKLPERSEDHPEGARKIGKLQIFSDGTTEMKIGGIVLDVSPGTLSECRHEVAIFSTIEEECIFLGSIADKKVCTPSLKYLCD